MIQEHGSSGSSSDQVVGAAATPPKSPKPRRKSFAHTEKEVVTTGKKSFSPNSYPG